MMKDSSIQEVIPTIKTQLAIDRLANFVPSASPQERLFTTNFMELMDLGIFNGDLR